MFSVMKADYQKLQPNCPDDWITTITMSALWYGINLFFTNGLISDHCFPTFQQLYFDEIDPEVLCEDYETTRNLQTINECHQTAEESNQDPSDET
jgi:hypothetical protein